MSHSHRTTNAGKTLLVTKLKKMFPQAETMCLDKYFLVRPHLTTGYFIWVCTSVSLFSSLSDRVFHFVNSMLKMCVGVSFFPSTMYLQQQYKEQVEHVVFLFYFFPFSFVVGQCLHAVK